MLRAIRLLNKCIGDDIIGGATMVMAILVITGTVIGLMATMAAIRLMVITVTAGDRE